MPPRKIVRARCSVCGRFLTKAGRCNWCIARSPRNGTNNCEELPAQSHGGTPAAPVDEAPATQQLNPPTPPCPVAPPPYPPPQLQQTPPVAQQVASPTPPPLPLTPPALPPTPPPPSPAVTVSPGNDPSEHSDTSSADSSMDSDINIDNVPEIIYCHSCLCEIDTHPVDRDTIRCRIYSAVKLQADPRPSFDICETCLPYISKNNNVGEPLVVPQNLINNNNYLNHNNNNNLPHGIDNHSDVGSDEDDASSSAPSIVEPDEAQPARADNKNVKWKFGWRSFLTYFVLKSNSLLELRDRLSYIPKTFSDLWGQAFLHRLQQHNRVSVAQFVHANNTVQRKIHDISTEFTSFHDKANSGNLAQLTVALNDTAVATTRCPFGCTEFTEHVGSISYNHLLKWAFPQVTAFGANADLHLKGARLDFTKQSSQYGFTIRSAVRITIDNGLVLCTCRNHDNGSVKSYVHVPQNPHGTMPSAYSDQLTPVIFSPKPFRGMKAKYSSHTWQMRSVQGGFSGLSSFSLTSKPKWNIRSEHHADLQQLYVTERPDLNSFIQSSYSNDGFAEVALSAVDDDQLPSVQQRQEALAGATYVPLQQSIRLLHSMKHKVSIQVVDDLQQDGAPQNELDDNAQQHAQDGNDIPIGDQGDVDDQVIGDEQLEPPQARRNITWPLAYALPQTTDAYGTRPQPINPFAGKFLPLLWLFIRILTFLPNTWTSLAKSEPVAQDNLEEQKNLHATKAYLATFLPGVSSTRRHRAGDHRGSPINIQHYLVSRARTTALLPVVAEDAQSMYTGTLFAKLIKTLPHSHSSYLNNRETSINSDYFSEQLALLTNDEVRDNCSVFCICTQAARTRQARVRYPDTTIVLDSSAWKLVGILRADGDNQSPWNDPQGGQVEQRRWSADCYLRNTGDHTCWFKTCRNSATECLPEPVDASLRDVYLSWNCLIYVRVSGGYLSRSKLNYLQFTGGQGTMICHAHETPLIVTPPTVDDQQRLRCSYKDQDGNFTCDRFAKWSCPTAACTASLCRTHSKQVLDHAAQDLHLAQVHQRLNGDVHGNNAPHALQFNGIHDEVNDDPLGQLIQQQHEDFNSDSSGSEQGEQPDLLLDGAFEVDDPLLEDGDAEYEDEDRIPMTNAADIPVVVDRGSGVSGHVLLNKHYGLLNRPGSTNYMSAQSGQFFQRLTARFAGASIPLLYPEGMLFPSIFWKSLADGTVVGALPHCLWTAAGPCHKAGFASLSDHVRTRLTDPTLLTSTDPRVIQFYFDALFNLQLSYSDSRVVLSRGWEHLSNDPSTFQTLQAEGRLPFGEADSRKRVNELAAEIAKEQPTYFYTHSCNQSEHFGVRPIFQWVEEHYKTASEEERNSAVQAALVPILRAWERAGTYLMKYIETSHEQPLGPVKKIWWRWEFQTTRGNLPHIHALVWTGEDPESDAVRGRVCSKLSHCFNNLEPMIDAGLVRNFEHAIKLKELAATIHEHSCHKSDFRCCKKRDRDGKPICRFPRRPPSNEYSTKTIDVLHTEEALNILQGCGLAAVGVNKYGDEELLPCPELTPTKHTYPADPDARFSPMNDWIFAAARSSDNLQICSPAFTARYLAKYAAGEEERARVFLKAGQDDKTLIIEQQNLRNLKVTGAAIAATNDKSRERQSTAVEGRTLSLTEAVWWLLGFPYVHLCSHYVHINTGYKQDRGGVIKHQRQRVRPGVQAEEVAGHLARAHLHFPPERQFTDSQRLIVLDSQSSNISPDAISKFSVRPPELMFINTLTEYFECTVQNSIPKSRIRAAGGELDAQRALLRANIAQCPWLDGFDKEIKILPQQLQRVKSIALSYVANVAHSAANRQLVQHVIDLILDPLLQPQVPQDLAERFLECREIKSRIAVLSNPLPRYADRFLVHLVLSLGSFTTEVDLFSVNHLRQSFQVAGLVQDATNVTQQEVNDILNRYVLKQLLYMPGGTVSFDKHLVSAHSALTSLLVGGDLQFHSTPLVLRHELVEQASNALIQRTRQSKQSFAEALHCFSNPIHGLPSVNDLVNATQTNPIDWEPEIHRGETQTLESFQEQQMALDLGVQAIDHYLSGQYAFVPAPILLGPPGSGKSHVSAHWGAYALARGLNTVVTSVASERAASLGGEHIHLVFSIPVSSSLSSRLLAERALTRLARDPVKMQWLKSIRVFIHEEIGTEGAELLDVQNKILQFLHNSSLPFGGVLIMGSGDPNQLPPIRQTLIWTSPSIITTMRLFMLKKFVRSSTDENLQEVLTLFQKLQPTEDDIQRIQELIANNCKFLPNWDDVPQDALQIFGHREAEQEAITRKLDQVRRDTTIIKTIINSTDQYTLDGGHVWITTNQVRIVHKMNRKLQAPQSVTLFVGAVMRFTCNDNSERRAFHQSQLCVVQTLPVDEGSFTLRVAPPGRRNIPQNQQEFIDQGWQELIVSKSFTIPQRLEGTMMVRREQYPVRHYIASTIHKVMGDTLGMVATQISDKQSAYKLWLKSQLYVIVSRVRKLAHIYFIGNPAETMLAIRNLLAQYTQWEGYVRHIVEILSSVGHAPLVAPPVIQLRLRPFRSRDTPIPPDRAGYVYIIVSTTYLTVSYIGQTTKLDKRVDQHNGDSSVGGARFTALAHFRPWGLLAYISGFDNLLDEAQNRANREHVEHTWDHIAQHLHGDRPTPLQILDAWLHTFDNYLRADFPNLVMVQCADI